MGVQTRTRAGNGFRMWQRSHMTGVALCVALSERHGVLCAGSHPTVDPVSKNIFLHGFLKTLNQEPARNPLSSGELSISWMRCKRKIWMGREKEGFKGWNNRAMPRASPPFPVPAKHSSFVSAWGSDGISELVACSGKVQFMTTLETNIYTGQLRHIFLKRRNKVACEPWCILSSHSLDLLRIPVPLLSIAMPAPQPCGFTPLLYTTLWGCSPRKASSVPADAFRLAKSSNGWN